MSISALVRGVEKRLRSAAVFDDQPEAEVGRHIGVQPAPGKPPPNFGQWFASVRWGGGRGDDRDPLSHNVVHGIIVTLTARLNYAPRDRQGMRLTTASDIYDLVDQIIGPNVIHGNYDVLTYANQLISGTEEWGLIQTPTVGATVNGYEEPLVLGPVGPERPVGMEWLGVESRDTFAIDIRFELARRVQLYEG